MAETHMSFAADIRPLFRPIDINSMKGVGGLDLSRHDEVSAQAEAILGRLQGGDMPCDGAWQADQVALFAEWISDGKRP
jgi:hypothetical protein